MDTVEIPLTRGLVALIDADDHERVSPFRWTAAFSPSTQSFRAICTVSGAHRVMYLHRFIMNVTDRYVLVDHINHETLDNRKANLRLCTQRENQRNKRPNGKTSPYKGVSRRSDSVLYRASIKDSGRFIVIGEFHSEIDAAKAYDEAAKELFGEFAWLNFPPEGTRIRPISEAEPRVYTSAHRGVAFRARAGKWRAQITVKGKTTYLGLFDKEEDAAAAYQAASRELRALRG